MTNDMPYNEHVLSTRIPEGHTVAGLEYGRHVSTPGWTGYYVRPSGSDLELAVARQTRASDELPGADADRYVERCCGDVTAMLDGAEQAASVDQVWTNETTILQFEDGHPADLRPGLRSRCGCGAGRGDPERTGGRIMSYSIRINHRPERISKRNDGERVQRGEDYEVRKLTSHGNAAGGVDHDSEFVRSFATLDQARAYVAEHYPDVETSGRA